MCTEEEGREYMCEGGVGEVCVCVRECEKKKKMQERGRRGEGLPVTHSGPRQLWSPDHRHPRCPRRGTLHH